MTFQLDLGEDADADIDGILEWSVLRFGAAVRDGYEALMVATLASIARNPEFPRIARPQRPRPRYAHGASQKLQ